LLKNHPTIGHSLSKTVKPVTSTLCNKFTGLYPGSLTEPKLPPELSDEIIGLELEVENICSDDWCESNIGNYFWWYTEDGSLRDNGKEFISKPLKVSQVPYAFYHLKTLMDVFNEEPSFTNRTSLHVHVNILDISFTELLTVIILYYIYENHFFKFAGTHRESSIFCVPLNESDQIETLFSKLRILENKPYTEFLVYLSNYWKKYNALNLCSIMGQSDIVKDLGTIEFRHLYGTLNTNVIYSWLKSILYLKQISKQIKLNTVLDFINTACTTSEYIELYRRIFKDETLDIDYKSIEKAITNLKLILNYSNSLPITLYASPSSVLINPKLNKGF